MPPPPLYRPLYRVSPGTLQLLRRVAIPARTAAAAATIPSVRAGAGVASTRVRRCSSSIVTTDRRASQQQPRRRLSHVRASFATMSPSPDERTPAFAAGTDPAAAQPALDALLRTHHWALDDAARGIAKTFYFPTFTKVLDFVNLVGIRCKSAKHHPVMTVEFGSVHVYWTTHRPAGLSTLDLTMARYCDEQAGVVGAVARADGAKC